MRTDEKEEHVTVVELGHATGIVLDVLALATHAAHCPGAAREASSTLVSMLEAHAKRNPPVKPSDREARKLILGMVELFRSIRTGVH